MTEKNHKLAAIVFTDVVGYTRQMEQDEQRTMQLLQKQREIVFPIVKSYDGEIIKELGDGLLMMFSSAVEAVRCSIEIQIRLKDEDLTIRAGIHVGEVIFKDGDVFGSAVNVAARIQPLAQANGLCISEDVKIQVQNKTDIRMNSIGIRELKGIKDPLEIYEVFIEGVTESTKKNLKYLFTDLWSRRVIHVLGLYIVGAYIIRMAVSSLVNNAMYSPHLVDLAWVILLSLIPTVFIITYFHGYRKSGKWTKTELIGLPANMVFSIFLVIFLFKGKDLGAATTKLTIEDENGNKTERTVLKNEFRKKTLVFFFENKTADTSLNWLQYGIPIFIEYDASQDMFMEVWGAENFIDKIRKAGYTDGIVTSLMENKKIAKDSHRSNFMMGTIHFSEGKYNVDTKLYNTQTGKLIGENQFSGEDVFMIVDDITLELKKNLGIPENHIEKAVDMSVSEISTSSIIALEYFMKGFLEVLFNNNWIKGVKLMEQAIEEDEDFIFAYQKISRFYFMGNEMGKAKKYLQIVLDNIDKLPDRQQYIAKYSYYFLNQEADKSQRICENWSTFYPDDLTAHQYLVVIYMHRGESDKAIQSCRSILSIDSEQYDYISTMANLFEGLAKYDSAEHYYIQYSKKLPKDYKSYFYLGKFYVKISEFLKAKENFEKALSLEISNISIKLANADVYIREGDIDYAVKLYNDALKSSKSARDSAQVYFELERLYFLTGQMTRSLDTYEKMMEKYARFMAPFFLNQYYINNVDKYILAGKVDIGYELLKKIEKELQPPFEKLPAFGYLIYYIELKEVKQAEKYVTEVLDIINSFGEEYLLFNLFNAKGKIAEIRGDYKTALENYKECNNRLPGEYEPYQWISRCYRELGDLKEAQKSIGQALKQHPFDPKNNYEAAMLYFKMKEKQKALEHLDRALEVWKDADANYEPYQKALALQKELGAV